MTLKLGATDATLRLGSSTPAAAYLGSEQVWSAARTLYYNAAVDTDWGNLANWWNDSGHSAQATSLPGEVDSVILSGSVTLGPAFPTVAALTMNDPADAGYSLDLLGLTVTGEAVFNGSSALTASIAANATFNDNASNQASLLGDAAFFDNSVNQGSVSGTATFNDSACNDGGTAGTFVPDPPPSC